MSSKGVAHRPIAGRLVIATHNPGKLKEMRELLMPFAIDAISAGELGLDEPAESGATFKANARIKACAAATSLGLPAFADDSGLAVDALGGEPGIYSARWAGPEKDFRRAMQAVKTNCASAAPMRLANARPSLSARFASLGPTDTSNSSTLRCTAPSSGPHAAIRGSAMTPCFCLTAMLALSAK